MRVAADARFAAPAVALRARPAGGWLLSSAIPPTPTAPTVLHWLRQWAHTSPDAILLSEPGGRSVSYRHAWRGARRVAAQLRGRGFTSGDRIAVFAPNCIEHLLVGMGTMLAGLVYSPVAPQYATAGGSLGKLRTLLELLRPALCVVAEPHAVPLLPEPTCAAELLAGTAEVGEHETELLDPLAPAKILFTSGSTGTPKGVIYTQAMMTANLAATQDVWPFLAGRAPVVVDWLPWNHAFGGNATMHLVLSQGGTLHVDDGRRTAELLRLHRPTFHGAVPAGYAAMLPQLERDSGFREAFFERLDAMFTAGAGMSMDLHHRLRRASALVRGRPVPILTGWGATETGPGATMVHQDGAEPTWIGTPLPGTEIALVPVAEKYELRVRGPGVTPGYWRQPELTAAVFDPDGFYRTGDAGALVDPERPELGLRFDGRIAEDFKLANGTWVNVNALRGALLRRADGALRDIVLLDADRPHLVALAWPTEPSCSPDRMEALLRAHNTARPAQSSQVRRVALLHPAPEELTVKGQLSRPALVASRAALIEELYAEEDQ